MRLQVLTTVDDRRRVRFAHWIVIAITIEEAVAVRRRRFALTFVALVDSALLLLRRTALFLRLDWQTVLSRTQALARERLPKVVATRIRARARLLLSSGDTPVVAQLIFSLFRCRFCHANWSRQTAAIKHRVNWFNKRVGLATNPNIRSFLTGRVIAAVAIARQVTRSFWWVLRIACNVCNVDRSCSSFAHTTLAVHFRSTLEELIVIGILRVVNTPDKVGNRVVVIIAVLTAQNVVIIGV